MRISPEYSRLEQAASGAAHLPVWMELSADLDTPVTAYLKLRARRGASFLLESVVGGERLGRYSFLGSGVRRHIPIPAGTEPWRELAALAVDRPADPTLFPPDLPPFWGGYVGWIGYDAVRHLEPAVGAPPADDLAMPAADFVEPEVVVAFDHARQRMVLVATVQPAAGLQAEYQRACQALAEVARALRSGPEPAGDGTARSAEPGSLAPYLFLGDQPELPDYCASMTPEAYRDGVRACQEHIRAGDIFQAVLSQRFSVPYQGDPFTLYRLLRLLNPSPYLFYQDWGSYQLVGSSPEVMVRLDGDRATVRPIAGTRRRGSRPDAELEAELLADPKERAEHLMLIDLGRNDLGRVCEIGSVRATELFAIERYSHVLHIVSNVEGRLAPGKTGLDLLAACFPAGTLSGAPKIRAMEILNGLEPTRRGPYGGAVGVLAHDGSVNMGITIRTFLVKDGMAHVQAGAGIVADSVPEAEYQECLNKAHALLLAASLAERAGSGADRPSLGECL